MVAANPKVYGRHECKKAAAANRKILADAALPRYSPDPGGLRGLDRVKAAFEKQITGQLRETCDAPRRKADGDALHGKARAAAAFTRQLSDHPSTT